MSYISSNSDVRKLRYGNPGIQTIISGNHLYKGLSQDLTPFLELMEFFMNYATLC